MRFRGLLRGSALMGLAAGACSSGPTTRPCVTDLPASCAPLYTPTFAQLYSRTFLPTCAQPGTACHAAAGAQGSLVLEDPDVAYRDLLGEQGARVRVIPGDPSCSLVVERLW